MGRGRRYIHLASCRREAFLPLFCPPAMHSAETPESIASANVYTPAALGLSYAAALQDGDLVTFHDSDSGALLAAEPPAGKGAPWKLFPLPRALGRGGPEGAFGAEGARLSALPSRCLFVVHAKEGGSVFGFRSVG